MNSMQDALREALEHPVEDIRGKGKRAQTKTPSTSAGTLPAAWWSILGSLAGAFLMYRAIRGWSKV